MLRAGRLCTVPADHAPCSRGPTRPAPAARRCLAVLALVALRACGVQQRLLGDRAHPPHGHLTAATSSPGTAARSTTTGSPTTTAPAPTTTRPAPAPAATTTVQVDLTDTTRPTVSHGATVAAVRHLPTTVYLPATAGGAAAGHDLPWLIFLHGYGVTPATYDQLLRSWASAGFAVAAPTLPLTAASRHPPPGRGRHGQRAGRRDVPHHLPAAPLRGPHRGTGGPPRPHPRRRRRALRRLRRGVHVRVQHPLRRPPGPQRWSTSRASCPPGWGPSRPGRRPPAAHGRERHRRVRAALAQPGAVRRALLREVVGRAARRGPPASLRR